MQADKKGSERRVKGVYTSYIYIIWRLSWKLLQKTQRLFQLEGTYGDHLQSNCLTRLREVKVCYSRHCPNASEHWQTGNIDHLSRKPLPVFQHTIFSEAALFSSICIYLPAPVVHQKPCLQFSLVYFINFPMCSLYIYIINKWSINKVGHTACLNFDLQKNLKCNKTTTFGTWLKFLNFTHPSISLLQAH